MLTLDLLKIFIKKKSLQPSLTILINMIGVKKKSIKGKGNKLEYKGAVLYGVKIFIKGNNNQITISEGTKLLNCSILITGDNSKINIGKNCILNNTTLSMTHEFGIISLGDKTTCNGGLIYAGESKNIVIGEDCMLSSNIDIRTTDSHSLLSLDDNRRINHAESIEIGNHVWLGNGCKVWKGASIGDNSIIGAISIVTSSIEGNCVAAGVPAKKIKENVSWVRELL